MVGLLPFVVVLTFITTASSSFTCPNQESIEQALIKAHIPGAAIIVVNATHTLYEQAFGYHSLSPQEPVDLDKSIFPLASISKTFIGVAVMQLVEKELVDLDADINQYLSEPNRKIFHPRYPYDSITLRKLLSHSSSIAPMDQMQKTFYQPGDNVFSKITLADMCFTYLHSNKSSSWLPKPPGSVTMYSNEGASLAALVVERVSKMPYDQYVKQNILKPLGINIQKTGFRLIDFENREELAKHYFYAYNSSVLAYWKERVPLLNITHMSNNFPAWVNIPFFSFGGYPAGFLRMSARSLSIYLRMFMNNGSSILTPRSVAEMRLVVGGGLIPSYNQNPNIIATRVPPEEQYGLGWYWETTTNGHRYIGHSGTLLGMKHLMLVNEKNTVGVIFLSNCDNRTTIYMSRESLGTIENIHLSLFQCFETNVVHSSMSRVKETLLGYVYVILFLSYLL